MQFGFKCLNMIIINYCSYSIMILLLFFILLLRLILILRNIRQLLFISLHLSLPLQLPHLLQLPQLHRLYLQLFSQSPLPSFQPRTIRHFLIRKATSIPPSQMFIVPTTPYSCMIINKYILLIFTSYYTLCPLELITCFKLLFKDLDDRAAVTYTVFFHDLAHFTWV